MSPGHFVIADDLINALTPKLTFDDPRAGDLAGLAGYAASASAALPDIAALFHRVSTPPKGEAVEANILAEVARAALAFGAVSETTVRAAFVHGATLAGADADQWLMAAFDALGGRAAMGNTVAITETDLAIAKAMAGRLNSGALALDMRNDIRADEMTVGQAVEFGMSFAALAMDNAGYAGQDTLDLLPHLTEIGSAVSGVTAGITDDVRSSLFLAQFMHDVTGATKTAANAYVVANHADDYLTGLAAYGMIEGGKTISQDLATAADVIKTIAMPAVQQAAANNGSKQAILNAAEGQLSQDENLYVEGINAVGGAAAAALGDHAPLGLGSIGAIAMYVSDPSLQYFNGVVQSVGQEVGIIPDNPIGDAGAIANFGQFVLENLGVGKLLGPFGDFLDGAVDVVANVSNSIDNALNAGVSVITTPLVGAGSAIVDTAEHLGDLIKDLFTGDFSGAGGAAKALVTNLGNDIIGIGDSIAQSVMNELNAVVDLGNTIVDTIQTVGNAITSVVNKIGDGIDYVLGFIFGD